jgi:hypothetical protein
MELHLHSPQYVFMAWCLVKHRDNFIFTFMEGRLCMMCRESIVTYFKVEINHLVEGLRKVNNCQVSQCCVGYSRLCL